MRYYVYLIAFFVSVVLAVLGGVAFRYLELENESRSAKEAYTQLQQLLGQSFAKNTACI